MPRLTTPRRCANQEQRCRPKVGCVGAARQHARQEREGHETMKTAVIAVCCILLASPALSQSVGEKTGINSALGVAPATTDFVQEVAISDMFELQSSKLAEQKGNAQEKAFAQQMVRITPRPAAISRILSTAARSRPRYGLHSTAPTGANWTHSRPLLARTSVRNSSPIR